MKNRIIKLDNDNLFFQMQTGYKFSSDSLILYDYIKNIKFQKIIELGCGDGIISILYALKHPNSEIIGLDINQDFLDNFKKTIEYNNIKNIKIIKADLVEYSIYSQEKFDLVIFNPPYYNLSEGKISANLTTLISKHQIFFTEYEMIEAAARLTDKRFIIIYPLYKITTAFIDLFKKNNFQNINIIQTLNKRFKIIDAKK
ncbi:MAG TPA: methyltransferase [bacterium]|nr:methyltransferase [bacterium]HPP87000.1 methyltransferase [bacterium]